jgi:hypothetical protein
MAVIWIDSGRFGPPLWTPANIATTLWLDAADASTVTTVNGAVSQWNDKSGNNRNVSQGIAASRPVYNSAGFNGKGALSFDGSNDLLQSNASITTGTYTGEFNVFWVATRSGNGGTILAERAGIRAASSMWLGQPRIISSNGTDSSSNHSIGVADFDSLQSSGGLVFHRHLALQRDILFLNGTQRAVLSGTSTNITGGTQNFRIGAREGGVGENWNGQICEIIVILFNPSTSDRQQVEGYLAHKWGLTANLPADHPYKAAAPTL